MNKAIPPALGPRPRGGALIRAREQAKIYDSIVALSSDLGVRYGEPLDDDAGVLIAELEITGFGPTPGDGILVVKVQEDVQTTPDEFDVTMPPTLFEASRAGVTYTYSTAIQRSATDGGTPETQYLWPSYVVGDLVLCALIRGTWRDLNIDGRQWVAEVP